MSYIAGIKNLDFDGNLGAYPTENYMQWTCLSNKITADLMRKLTEEVKLDEKPLENSKLDLDEVIDELQKFKLEEKKSCETTYTAIP